MTEQLSNRVAVVTGAGSGVGRSIAQTLTRHGMRVALLGRTETKLARVRDSIRAEGGQADCFPCDVGDIEQVEATRDAILAHLGPPQVLVNNAGLHCELLPIAETTPAAWMQTFQVNVFGPYLICRAFLPGLMDQGWGRIINVSSAASLGQPTNIGSVYQLSKVALNHFTRQLSVEVAGSGITANAIHPGEVQTEMWAAIKADAESRTGAGRNALTWAGMVEESGGDPPQKAADLVLKLLGPDHDHINGQFLWIADGIKAPMASW